VFFTSSQYIKSSQIFIAFESVNDSSGNFLSKTRLDHISVSVLATSINHQVEIGIYIYSQGFVHVLKIQLNVLFLFGSLGIESKYSHNNHLNSVNVNHNFDDNQTLDSHVHITSFKHHNFVGYLL